MQLEDKLAILADSAKYDVACTSSGVDRAGVHGKLGCSVAAGICHSFTPDGRCISLLKVLYSNACCYDCGYCVNRRSNDVPRATFTPRELAELTIGFYKRNYIEGLFLSSAVIGTPDYTMERMIEALRILRQEYHFNGYIHAKTIPGADAELVRRIGLLADRLSVNIELPSEASLSLLAPDKKKQAILKPMGQIAVQSAQSKKELVLYRHAPAFAPAGQSTQMIIGATPESDRHIMGLAESLYRKYSLKRVFFSAYLPVNSDSRLPALDVRPPLLREHRLYQADWLLRYYDFSAGELLTEEEPNFDPYLDPKCTWAVRHPEFFPRGDQHCAQGGPAAYSGYRAQKCIADFVRPPPAAPWNGGTQADGGCAETCPVLYYLQRPRRSPRNPAGNRRGAAGPQGICRGYAAAFAG